MGFCAEYGIFKWNYHFDYEYIFITFSNSLKLMKKRKPRVHFSHFFELVKTYRKSETTEYTFITFSDSWELRKSETLEFSFKPFSDSLKMKIFPSTWLFKLVKGNEQSSFQCNFTPFPDWNGHLRKRYTLINHGQ